MRSRLKDVIKERDAEIEELRRQIQSLQAQRPEHPKINEWPPPDLADLSWPHKIAIWLNIAWHKQFDPKDILVQDIKSHVVYYKFSEKFRLEYGDNVYGITIKDGELISPPDQVQ